MLWSQTLLTSLVVLTISVDSKYLGLPDPVKYISVSAEWKRMSNDSKEPVAIVEWEAYETDTASYRIEFVGVNDGKSITKTVKKPTLEFYSFRPDHEFSGYIYGLKVNETYIVRVFAVNERGQSPPSPDIIFFMDESQIGPLWNWGPEPSAPRGLKQFRSGNRVNVTWGWVGYRENREHVEGPLEFTFRYGDNKNTSLWKTVTTYDTLITLEDLENGKKYSGYVFAREKNLTSLNSAVIPISIDQDMSGLPEPIITIEPKKEVYSLGDPITVRCTLPPNVKVTTWMIVDDLIVAHQSSLGYETLLTYYTTVNEDGNTLKCYINDGMKRSSYVSWKVEKSLNDEYLKRRKEEIAADEAFMSFRKI